MSSTETESTSLILQQRADALAKAAPAAQTVSALQLTAFRLEQQLYAIATPYIFATVQGLPVTPVPMQPALLLGVISAYGYILPVINLAELLQLSADKAPLTQFLLLGQQQPELAIAVSEVTGQLSLSDYSLQQHTNDNNAITQGIMQHSRANSSNMMLLCGQQLLKDERLFFSI
jgi:chemotaxis signal transduction protein